MEQLIEEYGISVVLYVVGMSVVAVLSVLFLYF